MAGAHSMFSLGQECGGHGAQPLAAAEDVAICGTVAVARQVTAPPATEPRAFPVGRRRVVTTQVRRNGPRLFDAVPLLIQQPAEYKEILFVKQSAAPITKGRVHSHQGTRSSINSFTPTRSTICH